MDELLSIKLRPKSLKDIIGQEHLVGENKVIYKILYATQDRLHPLYLFQVP